MKSSKIILVVIVFYFGISITGSVSARKKGAVVKFLDVGQGDAILISTSNNRNILIDGGPDNEIDYHIFKEFGLDKCRIDVVVLTHPHKDHLKGLNRVLTRCGVGRVIFNDIEYDSRLYSEWRRLLIEMEIDTSGAVYGDSFFVDNTTFYVIWPRADALRRYIDDVNNTSIVLLMDAGDFEVLLMGDAEKEIQSRMDMEMLKSVIDGPLEVFKMAHHGSIGSLDKNFVLQLNPSYAVIGVGENSYGHPHEEVIEYFENLGVKVMRTDVSGNIEFVIPDTK